MLFISGPPPRFRYLGIDGGFQSRNREAFHFRGIRYLQDGYPLPGVSISQSRCFSFQVGTRTHRGVDDTGVSISQSRCFSFQGMKLVMSSSITALRFNLAIERLFISGNSRDLPRASYVNVFQSRNRDAFHFRSANAAAMLIYLI